MPKPDGDDADLMSDVFASDRDRTGNTAPVTDQDAPEVEAKEEPAEQPVEPEAKADDAEIDPKSPGRDPATGKFVPVTELVSERKKLKEARDTEARLRQEAEARATAYERQLQQMLQRMQPAAQQQAPQPPDAFSDPEGALRYQQQQFQSALLNDRLNLSEEMARDKYGDEAVEAALEAAMQAGLQRDFINKRHPYKEMVTWHRKTRAMQEIGNDPEAYRKKVREEVLAELKQGGTKPQMQPPQRLPGTLADATQAGSQGAMLSEDAMMAGLFASNRASRQPAGR